MNVRKAFCFFEQSGTFKREFVRLGVPAEDYDIRNDFGETDHVIDLFSEIRGGYCNNPSIFDEIGADDLVIAFFPCVRFEDQIQLHFAGNHCAMKNWSDERKAENSLRLHEELSTMYELWTKLFIVCLRRGIRLIVENPNGKMHYMKRYFPIRAKITDDDRTLNGDYYKKPTQYWFVNCEPEQGFVFEPIEPTQRRSIEDQTNVDGIDRQVIRSMIHPQYANRFIRTYILGDGYA